MKKEKGKKGPALLNRQLEEELRLQEITWLASRRINLVPVAVYEYSFDLEKDMAINRDEIVDRGVSFETGYRKDLVQVRIRPDVPAKTVVAILIQMIAAISEQSGDWMQEFSDATVRVQAQLKMEA